ncbi:MAG: MarR family transcriptional regulator [Burkholderiaceae bacterium]|nr:MarR family transcriptional regulator [Burkholderiaceae bacterium]
MFGTLVGQVARLWRSELDRRLASFGLTEPRWLVLLFLSRMGGSMSQRELAEAMGVQATTLVHILDSLEAEGLIERRTASNDRRSNSLHLGRKAGPVFARIEAAASALRSEILADVAESDLRTCLRVLRLLSGRLGGPARAARLMGEQGGHS